MTTQMNLKNDFYYTVLKDTSEGTFLLHMVTKNTWDNEGLMDEPDFLEEYSSQFTLPGYTFEASGMNGDDCLDTIDRVDGKPVDGQQLLNDLKSNGYTVNDDFGMSLEESSDGYFVKV